MPPGPRWTSSFSLLALLCLTACGAGTVLGKKATCVGSTAQITKVTGECERTIENLSQTDKQLITVETSDVAPFVTVDYQVSVEVGTVEAVFLDFHGQTHKVEASPGVPATGSVRVQLDPFNQLKFELTPLGGAATNVKYHVSFVCDCMP